jgi:MFS transporter, DHA2 family, multidrug resistance protein
MSATAVAAVPADRAAVVRRIAAALPEDLSHSPVLGILGVVLGAGIVTLAGRLLSLGLADLKGHVGIGFDEGAWIGTTFNVALMFIGPMTVYLGALLGPRRVLLAAGAVFTLVSFCLPFVQSYPLLILLLVMAGLSSGTFYPLTLSFVLRNIPLRYLAVTIALYATSIEGAVNFAPSLYGFYRDHQSWAWMFWTSALVTPAMMLCTYFGIPASPIPRGSGQARPSFVGLLYASAGFALLFAAIDQGQRLDWWRSGLFTGLFTAGLFLLVSALIRRLRGPNPLIDLPFLRNRDTVILGLLLFSFRFVLLATIILVPSSLAIRGLDAGQYGPAVVWTALPELCLAFVAALVLNAGTDSRLVLAIGYTSIAAACILNAQFTSEWAAESYFRTEPLMALGQSFAMTGLVCTIVLQALFSGAASMPARALTFSAFFHVVRLFGGQIGVVMMSRFIAEQEKLHSYLTGLHVAPGDWITDHTVRGLTAALAAKSHGIMAAGGRAVALVESKVRLQAYTLTYIDGFYLVAWACLCALVLLALLRKSPLGFGDFATSEPHEGARKEMS